MGQSERGRAVSFLTRDDTSVSHFLINRFKPVLTGTSGDKCGTSQKSFILLFVPHQCAVSAALTRGGSGLAFLVSTRYVNVVWSCLKEDFYPLATLRRIVSALLVIVCSFYVVPAFFFFFFRLGGLVNGFSLTFLLLFFPNMSLLVLWYLLPVLFPA